MAVKICREGISAHAPKDLNWMEQTRTARVKQNNSELDNFSLVFQFIPDSNAMVIRRPVCDRLRFVHLNISASERMNQGNYNHFFPILKPNRPS